MTIRFVKGKADKANTAEIFIYSDIGESWWGDGMTAMKFQESLKDLGAVDKIDVRINSYGGDVFDGLAIHRQLIEHSAEITTHVDGIAASIASVIAMAGKKIVMSESGFLMIHDAWTIAMGNAQELRDVAERVDQTSQTMAELYAKRSGKTADEMRAFMKDETWFTAAQAIEQGLADEVAENMKVAARICPEWARKNFAKAPQLVLEAKEEEAPKPDPNAPRPKSDGVVTQLRARKFRLQIAKRNAQQASG